MTVITGSPGGFDRIGPHDLAPDRTQDVPNKSQAPAARLHVLQGDADDLLTVRQVAKRLGVSTATVYKLVERGELPHVRVSNAIRVRPRDLAAYINGEGRADAKRNR